MSLRRVWGGLETQCHWFFLVGRSRIVRAKSGSGGTRADRGVRPTSLLPKFATRCQTGPSASFQCGLSGCFFLRLAAKNGFVSPKRPRDGKSLISKVFTPAPRLPRPVKCLTVPRLFYQGARRCDRGWQRPAFLGRRGQSRGYSSLFGFFPRKMTVTDFPYGFSSGHFDWWLHVVGRLRESKSAIATARCIGRLIQPTATFRTVARERVFLGSSPKHTNAEDQTYGHQHNECDFRLAHTQQFPSSGLSATSFASFWSRLAFRISLSESLMLPSCFCITQKIATVAIAVTPPKIVFKVAWSISARSPLALVYSKKTRDRLRVSHFPGNRGGVGKKGTLGTPEGLSDCAPHRIACKRLIRSSVEG